MQDEPNPPAGFEPLFRTSPFLETIGPLFYRKDGDGFVVGLRVLAEARQRARRRAWRPADDVARHRARLPRGDERDPARRR